MDWSTIIQIAISAALAVISFLYNDMKKKVDKTHEDFMAYKVHVAETFVTTDQLTRAIENLSRTVESVAGGVLRIETRLNHQIDNRSQ